MNFNELSVSGLYINKLQMVNNFLSGLSYGKILSGECGNGKSTVMSMIDMLYSQEKCNLSEWSELKKQVNDKIPVIKVSFSDFKPGTYEDIIAQTAGMLKNLYLQYTDYILTEEYDNYRYKEYFLDVIEGKCDDLESGLERLIRMICDAGIEKNERPVLLVDEPYEPIHICEKQDYDKTKEFFKRFFHFTECQAASKMIFFNSYPINSYYAPYIYDCFVKDIYSRGIRPLFFLNKQEIIDFLKRNGVEYEPSDFDNLLREEQERFIKAEFKFNDDYDRYFRKADFKENDYIYSFRFAYKLAGLEFEECSNTVPEKTVCDLDKIINKNRTAVSEHKKEVELRRKKYDEEKKQRYAKPFTITVDFPTKYIGIRKLPEIKETEMLYRLSEKIRELYRIYSREDKDNSLYKYMQGMDRNIKTDWDCNKNDLEKQIVSKHGLSDREISIKNDYPWCQIECRIKSDEPEISMHSMIKVYA
ncbi:MAG: hypothetical protein Q4D76_20330, partial [Oscillospiraceae bacterium]|nr:hypothetical protein [Oscillospiraceae bacterium]